MRACVRACVRVLQRVRLPVACYTSDEARSSVLLLLLLLLLLLPALQLGTCNRWFNSTVCSDHSSTRSPNIFITLLLTAAFACLPHGLSPLPPACIVSCRFQPCFACGFPGCSDSHLIPLILPSLLCFCLFPSAGDPPCAVRCFCVVVHAACL